MSNYVAVGCHTCQTPLNGKVDLPAGLQGLFEDLGAPVLSWNGKLGVKVLPALQAALKALQGDDQEWWRSKFDDRTYDTWSRIDFALEFLEAMRDAICRDPYAKIVVS